MAAEMKTRPTDAAVADYVAAQPDPQRRQDCDTLIALMREVTGHPPVMWGPSIVGFDRYHYRYASGREGDMAAVGFSSRKPELAIHLLAEDAEQESRLATLGKHRMGKSCLYVRRLADVDLDVLRQLVQAAHRQIKRQYPEDAG